jgi:hypothetical protein
MPIRTTYGDLTASGIDQTLGFPNCNSKFLKLANRAQLTLSQGGRWFGTVVTMRFCQYQGCITFPREVGTVERMDICQHSVYVRNQWWEFQTNYVVPSYDRCKQYGWSNELLPKNKACQFQDLEAPAYYQLYPQSAADVGKVVLLQGINAGTGQYVTENVTLALPYAQSAYQYAPPGLSGVQKPVCMGQINVTAFYPSANTYAAVAIWDATDTAPWYNRFYLVNRPKWCCDNVAPSINNACTDYGDGCTPALLNCPCGVAATFLVRREFIPVGQLPNGQGDPSAWLFIGNIPALMEEMQALKARDQNQFDIANGHHAAALQYLNDELDKYQPPQQITTNVQPYGSAQPARVMRWFV